MDLADLHIHSIYSDGTLTPEEIIRDARARGVKLISVCDHNEIQGTLEIAALARGEDVRCICGVEMDALYQGMDIHILGYGADFTHEALLSCIRRARARLDEMSDELLRRMSRDYPQLDCTEYESFVHDVRLGGWKMLQYLCHKGITAKLRDGFDLYARYGVHYGDAGFDVAETVIRCIHAAGGRAVLAHPGVMFPSDSMRRFNEQVEAAMELGLDGIECYYPHHSPGVTRLLLELCTRKGAMITAGSDCHGAFNHNQIGQTRTPTSALRLNGLI